MFKKTFGIAAAVLIVASLASCSSTGGASNETVGTIGGAAVGGVIGATVAKNDAAGAVVGAAIGGVIGNRIGHAQDVEERNVYVAPRPRVRPTTVIVREDPVVCRDKTVRVWRYGRPHLETVRKCR